MAEEILGAECRFVVHVPTMSRDVPDIHLIKEQVWKKKEDGTVYQEPNVRIVKDYKRPIWVTKPNKRNHQQKKEWEHEDNLHKSMVTESNMKFELARLLNKQWSRESVKELSSSPYVYGTDISSAVFIKQYYKNKYPDLISSYTICTFDIETDVVNGTDDPIMASAIFKDKIYFCVDKEFVKGFADVTGLLHKKARQYIEQDLLKRNYTIEFIISDGPIGLIRDCFNKIHEWKPDFLAIWNMNFDIPEILETLEKYNVDPKEIICDPSVPMEFRYCKYKKGPTKKVTSSGVVKPIDIAMQWHTLVCTSSFYVIDAMCTYRHVRLAKQEEPSYSLDAILTKEKLRGKLKFEEADGYTDLAWHKFMQTNYKLEYCIYNIFDSLAMMELELKINDLSSKLPTFSGSSEFSSFRSQPKRIIDSFFFDRLAEGYVLGSGSSKRKENDKTNANNNYNEDDDDFNIAENDDADEDGPDEILSLKDWIMTLPSHLMTQGLKLIVEDNGHTTLIRCYVYDSDSVSAYPTVISCLNISRETTRTELIDIRGVDEAVFRFQGLNLVQGNTNAIEYCTTMFEMPKPYELLKLFN